MLSGIPDISSILFQKHVGCKQIHLRNSQCHIVTPLSGSWIAPGPVWLPAVRNRGGRPWQKAEPVGGGVFLVEIRGKSAAENRCGWISRTFQPALCMFHAVLCMLYLCWPGRGGGEVKLHGLADHVGYWQWTKHIPFHSFILFFLILYTDFGMFSKFAFGSELHL